MADADPAGQAGRFAQPRQPFQRMGAQLTAIMQMQVHRRIVLDRQLQRGIERAFDVAIHAGRVQPAHHIETGGQRLVHQLEGAAG